MNIRYGIIPALCITAALLASCSAGTAPSADTPETAESESLWDIDNVSISENTVTIINRRKSEMYTLCISPSSEEDWTGNLIGDYPLPVGGELDVKLPVSPDNIRWDIRLEDQYHENVEIREADLTALVGDGMVMELAIEDGEDKVFIYQEIIPDSLGDFK